MQNQLRALQERIAELQEQNASLRESASTFAQLAERLNQQLRDERLRAESARRRRPRAHSRPVVTEAGHASFV